MLRIPVVLVGLGVLAAAAQPAAAQNAKPWIHVHVEEAKGSKVDVNLPLSLVQIALKAAPDPLLAHGHLQLGNHRDVSLADLRKLWVELKKTGDADLVSVEDGDEGEAVSVKRVGELVQVRVDNKAKGEEVRVDVPVALLDALLSSEGETLNFDAAFTELAKRRGDIVTVKDGADKVRVWIDERS